jgi:hypothetical protein
MSVISGNDGKLNAVYEVLYDGDAFVLFSWNIRICKCKILYVLLEIANKWNSTLNFTFYSSTTLFSKTKKNGIKGLLCLWYLEMMES